MDSLMRVRETEVRAPDTSQCGSGSLSSLVWHCTCHVTHLQVPPHDPSRSTDHHASRHDSEVSAIRDRTVLSLETR